MDTNMNLKDLWRRVQSDLERQYKGRNVYNFFLSTSRLHSLKDGKAVIHVVSVLHEEHIKANYQDAIKKSLCQHGADVHQLVIEVPPPTSAADSSPQPKKTSASELIVLGKKRFSLNSSWRFDTFITGDSNGVACEAAREVVQKFKSSKEPFKPLYIYGDVGNGKSHLLHAIGWLLLENGYQRISYVTAANFTEKFTDVVQDLNSMKKFKKRFCSLDALLFDDFQVLSGRKHTVGEWKYVFEELVNMGKIVVVTASDHPTRLTGFPKDVISRFSNCLMTDIKKGDYELRLAILRQRLADSHDSKCVSDDILEMLAARVKTCNRDVLSPLEMLLAKNRLVKKPITHDMAMEVVAEWWQKDTVKVKADSIIKEICRHFEVSPNDLFSRSRLRSVARPRQVAMFLMKEMTDLSYPAISGKFNRKHTTAIHACERVKELQKKDMAMRQDIKELKERLRHEANN